MRTGMCEVDSDCILHCESEASIPIELTIDSARKLVVEPPATVGLGLCSAAAHDVSYDFSFHCVGAECVEGEEKSCRPPLSISHVPLLT